jgi:hypothetical protein
MDAKRPSAAPLVSRHKPANDAICIVPFALVLVRRFAMILSGSTPKKGYKCFTGPNCPGRLKLLWSPPQAQPLFCNPSIFSFKPLKSLKIGLRCGVRALMETPDRTLDGQTVPEIVYRELVDKFHQRLRRDGDCLLWTGAKIYNDYGYVRKEFGDRSYTVYAHRLAFVLAHGEIPEGKQVQQTCNNRQCCEPTHLIALTRSEVSIRKRALRGGDARGRGKAAR